ncbi:MAG TPA: lysylphosphatidylglycerol synthase transmembrane domain-containing protein [Polyangia bacterium]|nr:lysylphosphatidylglycerol synthase transmembrane domain-containing protein [Polyangia bacterium]
MRAATRSAVSLAARLAVVAAAFWFVLRGVNGAVVGATLRHARPGPLVAVVALNALVMGVRAVRLRLLLRGAAGLLACWLAKLTASAMNNVIPLRGGDMARLWMLQRHAGISKTGAAAVAVVEGLFDMATLGGLALIAAAGLRTQHWAVGAAAVLGPGAALLIGLSRRLGRRPSASVQDAGRWRRAFIRLAARVEPGVRALRQPGVISRVAATSLLSWMVELCMVVVCARAVHLPIGPRLAAVVLLAINVAMAVPSSPAGAGAFEGAVVVVLTLAGIDKSSALAFAVLYHLVQVVPVTVAGTLVVWRAGLTLDRLPADRSDGADRDRGGGRDQPVTSAMARPSQPLRPTV